jgi:hypothetical protein
MSWFMNLNQMQSINLYIMRENWDYRSEIPTLNGEFLRWEIRSRKTKIYTNVWRLAGLGKRRDKTYWLWKN